MLLVKTKLGLSNIHGIGLFADEFIPQGTIIFKEDEFTIKVIKAHFDLLDSIQKEFLDRYAYYSNGVYKCSLDNDRFMNHSDNPNTIDEGEITIARYDINVGEEITCNYHDIDENF